MKGTGLIGSFFFGWIRRQHLFYLLCPLSISFLIELHYQIEKLKKMYKYISSELLKNQICNLHYDHILTHSSIIKIIDIIWSKGNYLYTIRISFG